MEDSFTCLIAFNICNYCFFQIREKALGILELGLKLILPAQQDVVPQLVVDLKGVRLCLLWSTESKVPELERLIFIIFSRVC